MDRKSLVDKVFSLVSEEEALSFLKEYAYKDDALAKALYDRFLLEDSEAELRHEVRSIFAHAGNPYSRWGTSLDWDEIRNELSRMISKAEYFIQEGKYRCAACIASEIILAVGEYHSEDEVYHYEEWDWEDFCTTEACDLIASLVSKGLLESSFVNELYEDVARASAFESYRHYALCYPKLADLYFLLKSYSLDAEDFLQEMDKKIGSLGKEERRREEFLILKINYLRSRGREDDAEKVICDNFDLPKISTLKIDELVLEGKTIEALGALDKAISLSRDDYHKEKCRRKKFELYREMGDKDGQIRQLTDLLRSSSYDMYQDYLSLKSLAGVGTREIVSEIVRDLLSGKACFYQKETARICYEEGLLPELETCLVSWSGIDKPFETANAYIGALPPDARVRVLNILSDRIREDSVPVKSSHYPYIRQKIELLMDSCDQGKEMMTSLVMELKTNYSNRPAFMRELSKLGV
ncbi:MAG: hypothetical protein IJ202_05155 [Bacteroidales bacterium]|nr:hypothetical protein [Bacteroidales bacterium]